MPGPMAPVPPVAPWPIGHHMPGPMAPPTPHMHGFFGGPRAPLPPPPPQPVGRKGPPPNYYKAAGGKGKGKGKSGKPPQRVQQAIRQAIRPITLAEMKRIGVEPPTQRLDSKGVDLAYKQALTKVVADVIHYRESHASMAASSSQGEHVAPTPCSEVQAEPDALGSEVQAEPTPRSELQAEPTPKSEAQAERMPWWEEWEVQAEPTPKSEAQAERTPWWEVQAAPVPGSDAGESERTELTRASDTDVATTETGGSDVESQYIATDPYIWTQEEVDAMKETIERGKSHPHPHAKPGKSSTPEPDSPRTQELRSAHAKGAKKRKKSRSRHDSETKQKRKLDHGP